jgi:hypothetical protein
MQNQLAEFRLGRVVLHLLCSCQDKYFSWHWRGIVREITGRKLDFQCEGLSRRTRPTELDRAGIFQPNPLQHGQQGRTLCRLGTAADSHGGTSGVVQVTVLIK